MDIDCPHCINEAPVLASLWSNYSSRTAFLSVDVNFVPPNPDDAPRINSFRTTYTTPWVYAMDTGSVYPAYGVTSTPTTFILDRNGVVVAVFIGETGYASLASALDKALGSDVAGVRSPARCPTPRGALASLGSWCRRTWRGSGMPAPARAGVTSDRTSVVRESERARSRRSPESHRHVGVSDSRSSSCSRSSR